MKILGFKTQKDFFDKTKASGAISHAYLFTGPEMIGKRSFAVELANGISSTSDMMMVSVDEEEGQSISIANIRKAKSFLSLSTFGGEKKVVIIDNAHQMTEEAQNALLKILEEPSRNGILILVTHAPGALLSTITSRTQEIPFSSHALSVYEEFFENFREINQAQRKFLFEFSNGSIGVVAKLIEKNLLLSIKKDIEELNTVLKSDITSRFQIVQDMAGEKDKSILSQKILSWMLYLRTKAINDTSWYEKLRTLFELYNDISQPQLNRQLALENFALKL